MSGGTAAMTGMTMAGGTDAMAGMTAMTPGGTAAGGGMADMQEQRLQVLQAPHIAGETGTLVFRLTDQAGRAINSYDKMHESKMHLFSVDMRGVATPLSDFEHLHPTFLGDGTWRMDGFTAPSGGMDHIVADYSTSGKMTIAQSELTIHGTAAARADRSGGYRAQVVSTGSGPEGPIENVVLTGPDGRPVDKLGTFMGATAHMILFRPNGTERLGFSHGHAEKPISAGGQLEVETSMLTAGAYQGWLQFATPDGVTHAAPIEVRA